MIRLCCVIVMMVLLTLQSVANNVVIKDLKWDNTTVSTSKTTLTMTFNLSWENSWRDDFNYDAVYVFFKFKVKDAPETPGKEEWNHLYLNDGENKLGYGNEVVNDYSCWLCPLSVPRMNYNTGIYIYRNKNGTGNSSVNVTVSWNIAGQIGKSLVASQINNNEVLIAAHAIEMVYVPRAPFRIGDGESIQTFGKRLTPILPAFDVVKNGYEIVSSGSNGKMAADRLNENGNNTASAWVGIAGTNYWRIDFGAGNEKKIVNFGINASKYNNTYYPVSFKLQAFNDPTATPTVLWEGPGKDYWVMAQDAYPVEKAIVVDTTKAKKFRYYQIWVDRMNAGFPVVNSIAMSEVEMDLRVDKTSLIDGPVVTKDTLRSFGAQDGTVWTGTLPVTFPVGYKEFFAMKYEITQEQYVRFLSKLTYNQQNQILGNRLAQLQVGDYVFGEKNMPSCRNGIIVAAKPENLPVVFANNLNGADAPSREADGQALACNYMNIADMLAYADWACLRPLTEMEYEKMSRQPYPYMPKKGEFAWNTTQAQRPSDLGIYAGGPSEKPATGNSNFGNEASIKGPVRVGAFADRSTNREKSGAGFSGIMDLSGNLAEMYYNANLFGNALGMTVVTPAYASGTHTTAHGDGYLSAAGAYDGYRGNSMYWSVNPQYIAVRGGSWAADSIQMSVSNRVYNSGYLKSVSQRDSTISFRLGHALPDSAELVSVLTLANGKNTLRESVKDAVFRNVKTYTILGNKPAGMSGNYTFLWYMAENGGQWKLMDGENEQNLVFTGFRKDTLTSQTYSFKRKVVTAYNDSEISSRNMVTLEINTDIIRNGPFRCRADGTYARNAEEYRRPASPYKYEGATGSGVYRIDPDGAGPIQPFDVYCDMETDGGGWMLAGKFSNHDAKRWCADKKNWNGPATFGDVGNITAFEDAKSAAWTSAKVQYMMFQTMKVPGKAFVTTDPIGNRTLSEFFTEALANFPDVNSRGCFKTLTIKLVNATYTDFPWINPNGSAALGFKKNRITIAKYDGPDSQGIISGYDCSEDEADWGLGSLEDCVFNTNDNQVDVGAGGNGASATNNVLLFVK